MRKRSCDRIFDNILWYTIYLLPIICVLFYYFTVLRSGFPDGVDWNDVLSFQGFLDHWGLIPNLELGLPTDIVSLAIGNLGVMFFGETIPGWFFGVGFYFVYFIYVTIFHLFVDFILFIPRLCHKWMNAFTRTED